MQMHRVIGIVASVLAVCAATASTLHAREQVQKAPLAYVQRILLTVKGPDLKAINRENMSDLCLVALTQELNDEGFTIARSRDQADAELVFTGGFITVLEGRSGRIGDVQLSYAAILKDMKGNSLWSVVDDEWGDSAAEACEDAADELADDIAEAHEDALDD